MEACTMDIFQSAEAIHELQYVLHASGFSEISSSLPLGVPSQPQPPSSDVLKKKEKERLFREQQQRLKSTVITTTVKNPLDGLFGVQPVKQVTQGTASHVVQSPPKGDKLPSTTVKDTVGQVSTGDQPAEDTPTPEASKPSGSK